jgi:hypothetical protein
LPAFVAIVSGSSQVLVGIFFVFTYASIQEKRLGDFAGHQLTGVRSRSFGDFARFSGLRWENPLC